MFLNGYNADMTIDELKLSITHPDLMVEAARELDLTIKEPDMPSGLAEARNITKIFPPSKHRL